MKNDVKDPGYYYIIPSEVMYSDKVSDKSKLLYGLITGLSQKEGYCWATNAHMAKLYGVSSETISRSISQLEKNGFILVEIDRKASKVRKISLKTPLHKKRNTSPQKAQDLSTKSSRPLHKKLKHINIDINKEKNIERISPPASPRGDVSEASQPNQEYTHQDKMKIIDIFRKAGNISIPHASKPIQEQISKMFETYGVAETTRLAEFAVVAQKMKYAPTITSPTQLYHKATELAAFYEKEKDIQQSKKVMVSEEDLEAYKKMIGA